MLYAYLLSENAKISNIPPMYLGSQWLNRGMTVKFMKLRNFTFIIYNLIPPALVAEV